MPKKKQKARMAARGAALLLLATWLPTVALATDGVAPYEEFNKNIHSAETVSPLGDDVFGDSVDLYSGSTEFNVTDVSLPGNSALPVQLARRLAVEDRRFDPGNVAGFGDWDFDVPWIEGMFMQEDGWTLYTTGDPNARCSIQAVPNTYSSLAGGRIWVPDVWHGNQMHIPGSGMQTLLVNNQGKSPAYASRSSYPWVTKGGWRVGCVGSLANGYPGEGFKAVSPSGVTYTFNWMVVHAAPNLKEPWTGAVNGYKYFPRSHIFLLATRVEDRFGNWVKYGYSGDHLTNITSNDGRSISLNWSGNTIQSVTSAAGTWTYAYVTGPDGKPKLSSVTRPDGSKWTYRYIGEMAVTNPGPDDIPPNIDGCLPVLSAVGSGTFSYTVGAPSGANATFAFVYKKQPRSYVPKSCTGTKAHPKPPPNTNYPKVYNFFANFVLRSKRVRGPGLQAMTWRYVTTVPASPPYYVPSQPWDDDDATQPYIPPGSCPTCAESKTVEVHGPTSITRYTFGIQYARNEGQLLGVQVTDPSGNVLKTTVNSYVDDAAAAGEPFPDIAGQDLSFNYISPMGNRNRPQTKAVITQDGATFTTATNTFDAYARATRQTETSSLGYSRVNQTSYYDNTSLWVLGQVAKSTIAGVLAAQTTYSSKAQPLKEYAFGKLASTKAWNADGTLHSITDGNGHATTLSSWYRGLPRTVTWADGHTQKATVNGAGWITALTDENGNVTRYGHDPMGRLASITYPADTGTSWNQTLMSFAPVASSEYGIPAGHWKQQVHTGNGYTVTYYDALWRPLLTEHYDNANKAATLSQVVRRYDGGGNTIFASYPARNITTYSAASIGTHTTYDALGRATAVVKDSELGALPTITQYLSGFRTEVTDPRGNSTLVKYQAYGSPTTEWPVSIAAPEGALTTIVRDAFGKPLSITRTGTASGSPSLTRHYVYDSHQLLCKRIELEVGATAFGYDGAGNIAWSAAGLDLPNAGSCDASAARDPGHLVSRSYDSRNRLTAISYPDGGSNTTYAYGADGALLSQTTSNGGHPVTTRYTYDNRHLLTQETLSIPGTRGFSIGYGYDANGHLASNTWPDGRTLGYAPNALGQPTRAGAYAAGASYHPSGALAAFTYGSGAVHTTSENERGLPSGSADVLNGVAGMQLGYDYDGNGNVAAITDYLPGNVGDVDMTYDALDRLAEADSPMFGGDGKAIYGYDVLDNLLLARTGNRGSLDYAYNARNQLAALKDSTSGATLASYTYDAQGNLASKDGHAYQFDQANRLRNVVGVAGYLYDAAGRRVQKAEQGSGRLVDSQYSRAGQLMFQWDPATRNATDYIYLGGVLVARVVGNSSEVVGTVEGVSDAGTPTVDGWACSTGIVDPISVELFVGGTSGKGGTHIATVTANKPSEPAVADACQTDGTAYRFAIPLDTATRTRYGGQPIYVYGDSPVGNGNKLLTGSGSYSVPPNQAAPEPPATISVPATSSTGDVTVSWASSSGATRYVLQQQLNGGAWTQAYSGSATSRALNGLSGGTYVYRVQACNDSGCSGFTTSGSLVVALAPATPSSISVPATSGTGNVTVSWTASTGATRYVLQQQIDGGAWAQAYSGSATSRALSGLADGSYVYRVQACNDSGCSGWRTSGTLAVAVIPATPASISVPGSSSTGNVTVSWASSAHATRYVLQQQLNGGSWQQVYNGSATSRALGGLGDGDYTYRVQACNDNGCSGWRASTTLTVALIPVPPAKINVPSSSTDAAFTVSWSASAHASNYVLEERYNGGGWGVAWNGSATSTSVTVDASGTYQFQVAACAAGGCSGFTTSGDVVVTLAPRSAPSLTGPGTSSNGTFTLNWTAVPDTTSYHLHQTLNGTDTVVYQGSGRSWTSSGLDAGSYTYKVYACNTVGCGPASNPLKVVVAPHVPPAPDTAGAPLLTHVGIVFHVNWSAVVGATSYDAQQTDTATGVSVLVYNGGTDTTAPVQPKATGTYQYAARACNSAGCSAWTKVPHVTVVESGNAAVPASGSSVP